MCLKQAKFIWITFIFLKYWPKLICTIQREEDIQLYLQNMCMWVKLYEKK